MDEIELVVKIDEEMVQELKDGCFGVKHTLYDLAGVICNGIVLPKGHGRIGDLTKLYNEIDARNKGKNKGKYTGILALVGFADTIIEADKEERK